MLEVPVVTISERYFGDGTVGRTESATICERCLAMYVQNAAEVLKHELRAMFKRLEIHGIRSTSTSR